MVLTSATGVCSGGRLVAIDTYNIITGQSGLRFQGNEYQRHCGLLIGIKNDYPVFGHLRHIHIIDGSREPFHVS